MKDIEAWLAWAFREELPKAGSGKVAADDFTSAWGLWDVFIELGVEIDRTNRFGCIVDHSAEQEPHPMASMVGEAVLGLADVSFEAPVGYDLLGNLTLSDGSPLTDEERADAMDRGLALARIGVGRMPGIVMRFAMLGGQPSWEADHRYVRRMVTQANGTPRWFRQVKRQAGEGRPTMSVEVEGYDRTRGRPFPGAYRKTIISPDLGSLVAERAEYQAWALALAALAADIEARSGQRIEPAPRPLWPWESCADSEAFGTENQKHARLWAPHGVGEAKFSTRAA
ncbi:MAG: hypothetical protein KAG89_20190 [Fulvimarina manganoxydans]|uniref:hypothetical protein n=1 Tax=Fulvimarina manganoxydans TaxID=937218 RepID=UPI002355EB6D|nr:hypothetical protein [Fulvimarina manganoxydans]MCK5934479.1 hypothetical protein [Fulvimarina manganoxydans]